MSSDDIFDILLLLLVLAILTPIMIGNSIPMLRGDVGGFNTLIEKTAQETAGEIKPAERSFTREDVLLMALIADRKAPPPAVFQSVVDGVSPEITIDDLLTRRAEVLQTLNSHTTFTGQLKIETYVGSSGPRKWVVSRK